MIKLFRSTSINGASDKVWSLIRGFNGLPKWHPGIVRSELEPGHAEQEVGAIRVLTLGDGGTVVERLLAVSDLEHSYTYAIISAPFPVSNYVATLRVLPITDGQRTYVEWTAEFDTPADKEEEMRQLVGDDVFQAGFDALKKHF